MKHLPIGIQSIKKILSKGEYIYVDKTGFIKELISGGIPHYFMSRPRRFGKSLFLDTLREIFEGNKELFKGCQIYESDYPWEKHPVLYFDFAQILNTTPEKLEAGLQESVQDIAKSYRTSISGSSSQSQLKRLIIELSTKNRVVVLVDEYDHPIINNLENLDVAKKNRNIIKGFFTTLKSLDRYLKFTFITGVSKFSQVSLFSGVNNLTDITMEPEYAGMMGYTEEELRENFQDHTQAIAKEWNTQEEEVFQEIRKWYNGYRFTHQPLSVYNPFSTLKFLKAKRVESYWYSTGTPSFLIHQLNDYPESPESLIPLSGTGASKVELSNISDFEEIDLVALMFQTGYLTITDYDEVANYYSLDFPNREVREAFFQTLVRHFAKINRLLSEKCRKLLEGQNLSLFFKQIKTTLAGFPYPLFADANERAYQGMVLGILKGMGLRVRAEANSNQGRADLVIEMPKTTYVIELKLNSSPENALKQIAKKEYYEQFLLSGREVITLGVNFSSERRNIDDWKGILFSSSGKKIKDILPEKSL